MVLEASSIDTLVTGYESNYHCTDRGMTPKTQGDIRGRGGEARTPSK